MDLWSKDYLWKGFTIFELKDVYGERKDDSRHESSGVSSTSGGQQSVRVEGSNLASSSAEPGGQQSVRVEGGNLPSSYAHGGLGQVPPMMYGPTSYIRDPTPLNVTVNVNVAGGTTSSSLIIPPRKSSQSASSGDSEFEMVDED